MDPLLAVTTLGASDNPVAEAASRIMHEAEQNSQVMEQMFQPFEVNGPSITNSNDLYDSAAGPSGNLSDEA